MLHSSPWSGARGVRGRRRPREGALTLRVSGLLLAGESDSAGSRGGGGVPPPSAGDLGGCDGGLSGRAVLASSRLQDRRRRPEALERAIDAEEELPQELRDRREALKRAQGIARIVAGEHDGRPRHDEQRPADQTEPRGL